MPVSIYTPAAPLVGGASAGKYRRPRNVWVVVHDGGADGSFAGPINARRVRRAYKIATNVDSRYTGDRSAYGQALAAAKAMAARLRAEYERELAADLGAQLGYLPQPAVESRRCVVVS